MTAIDALPERAAIDALIARAGAHARVTRLATVEVAHARYPIDAIAFGATDPAAPALVVVAGVHGLERIGTAVALAFLQQLIARLAWDAGLHDALAHSRVVVIPLVNPGGMALGRRANPRGVDLMRNAPVHVDAAPMPVVGGQRWSPRLPWYMGTAGALELEARALIDAVEAATVGARLAIAIDLHSGFGLVDRIWFPYARTRAPAPHLAELAALRELLDDALPNHVYTIEPTARAYTIAGDLWDHLYDRACARGDVLLPLTLEMGSWAWVRKNPAQVLSRLGGFNPLVPHRHERTLRRHLPLLEFLHRAARSAAGWAALDETRRAALTAAAFATWYAV